LEEGRDAALLILDGISLCGERGDWRARPGMNIIR